MLQPIDEKVLLFVDSTVHRLSQLIHLVENTTISTNGYDGTVLWISNPLG